MKVILEKLAIEFIAGKLYYLYLGELAKQEQVSLFELELCATEQLPEIK